MTEQQFIIRLKEPLLVNGFDEGEAHKTAADHVVEKIEKGEDVFETIRTDEASIATEQSTLCSYERAVADD